MIYHLSDLLTNQVFAGGAAIALVSGMVAAAYRLLPMLQRWAWKHFLFTVEIDNTDPAFAWVRGWVAARSRARFVTAGVTPPFDRASSGRSGRSPGSSSCRAASA
jgi:hypothetical protein